MQAAGSGNNSGSQSASNSSFTASEWLLGAILLIMCIVLLYCGYTKAKKSIKETMDRRIQMNEWRKSQSVLNA